METMNATEPNDDCEIRVSSLHEYVEKITSLKLDSNFLFRGHENHAWKLEPRLNRINNRTSNDCKVEFDEMESRIFNDIKLRMWNFYDINAWSDLDTLALAQHHGAPTRLLDWTNNALVALWFAVGKPREPIAAKVDSCVWILKHKKSIVKQTVKNVFDEKELLIHYPKHIARRISAQSGYFTIHPLDETTGKCIEIECDKYNENIKLKKIVICSEQITNIRYDLDIFGVNEWSVYPEIDGMCRHVSWLHTIEADETKRRFAES